MNIFMMIARVLNLSWGMVELVRENNVGGKLVDGKWRGGVMEALTSGDADVALVAKELDRSLTEHIDFTYPWAAVSGSI